MMRIMMALALAATLAGCDEKKDAAATTTTNVAPTPTPTTAAVPTASGAAVAPSGAAVAPSGAAVAPSGAAASGETAKGEKQATKPAAAAKATKLPPPGGMPHGNPEDGTLKYAPPPTQNPPAKKGATTP